MDNNGNNSCLSTFVTCLILLGVGIYLLIDNAVSLGIIAIVICVLIAVVKAIKWVHDGYAEIDEENRQKAEIEENNKKAKEGLWEFPCEDFYISCIEDGIKKIEGEYNIANAKRIAKAYFADNKIDEDNCADYLTTDNLRKYYKQGKAINAKRLTEETEKKKQVRKIALPRIENIEKKHYDTVAQLHGVDKRLAMIEKLIEDTKYRIKLAEDSHVSGTQAALSYNKSASLKEKSWGTAGGLASAIGGPVAGAVAASQVMAENEAIKGHNDLVKQNALNMMMSNTDSYLEKINRLENDLKLYTKQYERAQKAVVLDSITSDDIWNNYTVKDLSVEKTNSGALRVALLVAMNKKFNVDVPKNVSVTIDGSIKIKMSYNNQEMETVPLILSRFGGSNEAGKIHRFEGICASSVEYDNNYDFEVLEDTKNFWIIAQKD